jgi:hypothetical protein
MTLPVNENLHWYPFIGVSARYSASEVAWKFHSVDIRTDLYPLWESTSLPSGWTGPDMTILSQSIHEVRRPSWFWCIHNLYKNGIFPSAVSCFAAIIRYDVVYGSRVMLYAFCMIVYANRNTGEGVCCRCRTRGHRAYAHPLINIIPAERVGCEKNLWPMMNSGKYTNHGQN